MSDQKKVPSRSPPRQSAASKFAKLLDSAPTPWIRAAWDTPDPDSAHRTYQTGTPGVLHVEIVYRLWVKRRGKSLHVETHSDSPTCPGIIRKLHRSRGGTYEIIRAGIDLVRISKWNPSAPTGQPRAMWNSSHPSYTLRNDLALTVSRNILRVLEPRRGRPTTTPPTEYEGGSTPLLNSGYASARRNRRNEMLAMTERMHALVDPVLERFEGNRKRMAGFNTEERAAIMQALFTLKRAITSVQIAAKGVAQSGKKMETAAPLRTLDADRRTPAKGTTFDFTLPDTLPNQ